MFLKTLLPLGRAESSSGTQLEKIIAGEYLAGFFVSAGPAYPKVADSGGLLALTFLDDGTVVLPRGIGIPARRAPRGHREAVHRLRPFRGGPARRG